MKRYIKVKGQWIDTLEQCKGGFYYYIVDGYVYYLYDETMIEIEIGILEDETDVL